MANTVCFRVEEGINVYAMRVHQRMVADAYYSKRWRELGHAQAARQACDIFGHDVRGDRCDRCALGVAEVRAIHLAGKHPT